MSQVRAPRRTSFAFNDEALSQLRAIKARSRLASDSDVIRAALDCFDELLGVVLSGYTIVVRDRRGQDRLYSPFAPFVHPGVARSQSSRPTEDRQRHRKSFVFPPAAAAKLNAIRQRSRYQTDSDVIRAALDCYDELVAVVTTGDTIHIRVDTDHEHSYTPFAPLVREGLELSLPSITQVS